ncbi:MAG: Na/Pi cotransporter family protein [Paludibacteraceae bacterium]|nr:Na/Pi cotransporter family protein [Paludibacteraceae bacterium]MBR6686219.1 Na/Pi cotransporter family protein [Paludibacteraceae bacterium]
MNYSFYDFLTLIGSLGVFLFGMKMMSEGLQKVAGERLRSILTAMTKNRFIGLFTGLLITTLIQSSSATTVMVVSFVNAGLLNLAQSISVIMGANIGTTATAWIISLFGFKFSISALTLPIIAISIPFIFSSNNKRKSIGEFLIGFALLFMGLDMLKNSVPDLSQNPDMLAFLNQYTNYGYGSVLIFLLVGTILTIVVQSSSATMAITLIMCTKGWISYDLAVAMVLGENIGTTITANIAAIPANVPAKRAAMAHLIFNLFGVVWVLAIFYPFTNLVTWVIEQLGQADPNQLIPFIEANKDVMSILNDKNAVLTPAQEALRQQYLDAQVATSYGLSLFHTMFNLTNSALLIGLVKVIEKTVTFIIPQKVSEDDFRLTYISTGMLSTSELSILQADKEISVFASRNIRMFSIAEDLYNITDEEKYVKQYERIEKYESISDRMEVEIASYLTKVAEGRLSDVGKKDVHAMLRVISEIESIGDGCHNIARTVQRKRNDALEYPKELDDNIKKMFSLVEKALNNMQSILGAPNEERPSLIKQSLDIEKEINDLRNEYKMLNATKVKERAYPYPVSVTYMDIISECEKIGDYILNVVEQYQETKKK